MSTSTTPPSRETPPAARATPQGLVVGGEDLDPRALLVLHSLLRVLDGRDGLRLRAGERREDCDVLFVPARWPHRTEPHRVVVRVCADADEAARLEGPGLRVVGPLRLSNVTPVLHACRDAHRADEARDEAVRRVAALHHVLSRHVMARDRRTQVFQMQEGGSLVVDFGLERVHASCSVDDLLSGRAQVGADAAHRASDAEREAAQSLPATRLRDLVWRLSRHLGDAAVAGGAPDGRYQLVRWPDAVALAEPGVPRLAALLTHRPMSLAAAAASSGLPIPRVRWFLHTALAFGVALCVDDDGRLLSQGGAAGASASPHPDPSGSASASTPPRETAHAGAGPAHATVARSLLGRLRQHLRLW